VRESKHLGHTFNFARRVARKSERQAKPDPMSDASAGIHRGTEISVPWGLLREEGHHRGLGLFVGCAVQPGTKAKLHCWDGCGTFPMTNVPAQT
jgi:hypothetical protein